MLTSPATATIISRIAACMLLLTCGMTTQAGTFNVHDYGAVGDVWPARKSNESEIHNPE